MIYGLKTTENCSIHKNYLGQFLLLLVTYTKQERNTQHLAFY